MCRWCLKYAPVVRQEVRIRGQSGNWFPAWWQAFPSCWTPEGRLLVADNPDKYIHPGPWLTDYHVLQLVRYIWELIRHARLSVWRLWDNRTGIHWPAYGYYPARTITSVLFRICGQRPVFYRRNNSLTAILWCNPVVSLNPGSECIWSSSFR